MRLFDKFARASFRVGHLRLILPNGEELSYGDPAKTAAPVPQGEEWRGRPRLAATVRIFDMSFFSKLISRHDTGLGARTLEAARGGGGSHVKRGWRGDHRFPLVTPAAHSSPLNP